MSARTDLFAATDVSSTVKDFTVQSNISLSVGNTDNGKNAGVGGTSTGGVDITRCVYETDSSVSITNSTDCIGGVVGYAARNTKISYCANRSTVTTEKNDAYTGGVLGYVNSAGVTVKNCYNYGTVASDSDNYCGAIVRHLMKDTVDLKGKLTNNYYRADSAPAGLGNGSKGTGVTSEAKDNAAFASGGGVLPDKRRQGQHGC